VRGLFGLRPDQLLYAVGPWEIKNPSRLAP
jgi:hypothetical protein